MEIGKDQCLGGKRVGRIKRSPNSTQYRYFPSSLKLLSTSKEDVSKVEKERFSFNKSHIEVSITSGSGNDDTMTNVNIDTKDDKEASLKKMMSRKFI